VKVEKKYHYGKVIFEASEKKIMRRKTLLDLIKRLKEKGAYIEASGYFKEKGKRVWVYGKLPEEVDGIPYNSWVSFDIKINNLIFKIEASDKFLYFPAAKISVSNESEVEARNKLEKILREYVKI
jgi:hypothetical protein